MNPRTSTYSAASEDSPSQRNGQDSGQSDSASSTNTAKKCSPKTLMPTPRSTDADRGGRGDLIQMVRGNSNRHFAPTSSTSTETPIEVSPSSQGDFLASLSALPACAVDARHRRDRVWIVGRNVSDQCGTGLEGCAVAGNACTGGTQREEQPTGLCRTQAISNPTRELLNGNRRTRGRCAESTDCCRWEPEPDVGRVAHGIPKRVDRLKGLGNAIVPQVAYEILREIRKLC